MKACLLSWLTMQDCTCPYFSNSWRSSSSPILSQAHQHRHCRERREKDIRYTADKQRPAKHCAPESESSFAHSQTLGLPRTLLGPMSLANVTFLGTLGSGASRGAGGEACAPGFLPAGLRPARAGEPALRPRPLPPRTRSPPGPIPAPPPRGTSLFPSYSPYTGLRRRKLGGDRGSSRPNLAGDLDRVLPRLPAL